MAKLKESSDQIKKQKKVILKTVKDLICDKGSKIKMVQERGFMQQISTGGLMVQEPNGLESMVLVITNNGALTDPFVNKRVEFLIKEINQLLI